jgi:hypothetical protein
MIAIIDNNNGNICSLTYPIERIGAKDYYIAVDFILLSSY